MGRRLRVGEKYLLMSDSELSNLSEFDENGAIVLYNVGRTRLGKLALVRWIGIERERRKNNKK